MMRVLVTGASGNVGRFVVQELLRLGEDVVAAGTDPQKLHHMFGDEVTAVEFDFMRPETFHDALSGVDRIFLMRPPHLGSPEEMYPFIEAARERPIRLISFLSLMGVEKNTIPPHHKIEKSIEKAGIPFAHIRPGFFMQNLSGIHAEEIRKKDMVFIPAGKSRTSFIDAADIGLAAATILHDPEKFRDTAHTITGPEALDYDEIAEILSDVTGRRITYARPGLLKYRNHYIRNRGLGKGYVNVTVALYIMTRMGTAEAVTKEFFNLTGRQARTFLAFAQENIDAFRKDGAGEGGGKNRF